jgi:hypothetical protein
MPALLGQILRVFDAVLDSSTFTQDTVRSEDTVGEVVANWLADFDGHGGSGVASVLVYLERSGIVVGVPGVSRRGEGVINR